VDEHAVERLAARVGEAAGTPVELERPSDPSHGDYATNAALRLAGERRQPPRELAQQLAEAASALPEVARAEVAGPGFVNVWLTPEWFGEALGEILGRGAAYGAGDPAPRQRIQVELVSANPTGPVTVASARNGAYGDSVARLLEFAGHEVEREYYYNDAGAQIERFRASVEAVRRDEEPPEDGYRGEYVRELARLDGDPVPAMLHAIEETLERFRIHFDSRARQSVLAERLDGLLERLPTYERDGAIWVRASEHGDEQDRVLLRSAERGGLPTYRAADVAYLEDKFRRGFDRAIYVLGADHHGTRNWYAAVARMLGYDPERVEVLLYQLVHLTKGGELAKMSKRRGDVVFLDELIDEIGVDASRWYLVDRGPDQAIEIDVDLAAERSRKNPVYYVQYVHARTVGVFREAGDAEIDPAPYGDLTREERDVVKRLADFPLVAAEATHRRAPHMVAYYAIQLADEFHRFYHDRRRHRILGSEAQGFRLGLCRATQTVIARSLGLLGVDAPDRM
jgi:arginyl-tRNA synthetase